MFGTAGPIFTKFFVQIPVAVVRSSYGGIAIRYVLPVLWMTSCLAVMGRIRRQRRCDTGAESDVYEWVVFESFYLETSFLYYVYRQNI